MDRNQLNQVFENTNPNDMQIANIMNKITNNEQKRIKKPSLVLAILIISLFATTVLATGFFGLTDTSLSFLNPHNDDQAQYLSDGAYNIDQRIVQDGGTMHFKEVIGDNFMIYIFFDFIAPEGTVLDENEFYQFSRECNDVNETFAQGYDVIPDGDNTDNKISLYYTITSENGFRKNDTIKMEFEDLQSAKEPDEYWVYLFDAIEFAGGDSDDDYDPQVHLDGLNDPEWIEMNGIKNYVGEWIIEFDTDFKKYSKEIKVSNQTAVVNGYDVEIESISISPISITLKMHSDYTFEIFDNQTKLTSFTNCDIHYKDGTVEDARASGSMDHETGDIFLSATFKNVLNEKEIDYIEYFGEKLYIEN